MFASASTPNSDDDLPSPEVRAWIGLLLFIHLFAISVAVTSFANPSALQVRLKEVFAPYLVTFNFDLTHNMYPTARFHLTHEQATDVDFRIEVTAIASDGSTTTQRVPTPGLWPAERTRREQALANAAGSLIGNENLEGALPRAIGASILQHSGATRGIVKIEGHLMQQMEDIGSSDAARRDPYDARFYNTVFAADLQVRNGQVDLHKKATAAEVAPVEKGK